MSSDHHWFGERKPPRIVSVGVSALLVVIWGLIRVAVPTTAFTLTYAIPLLICVWTRDRRALWAMAAIFTAFHTVKIFWLLPPGAMSSAEMWMNYAATLANIMIGAGVVHGIIRLRERLEGALSNMRAQSRQLARDSQELSFRGEELTAQNEELQAQAAEISTLAEVLERRERLLQTLLDTARLAGTAEKALQQIAAAAIDLFPYAAAAAVYERRNTTLVLRALAGTDATSCEEKIVRDDFVEHALQEGCIALTNDVRLQDAPLPAALPGLPPPRAVLCAPVAIDGAIFGAFVVHVFRPHEFTDEEFRLVTWLSEQGARAVQALRVQTELRDADRRKTEFLATLSHELRNPLAPLGFALELIEAAPERHPTAIAAMRRQFQQLVRLVDDLLDATRLQRNKLQIRPSRIDLVAIVTQVIEALTPDIETSRHSIALDLPPEAVWIHADADRIAQVVTNLLNNAIRYTPPGGKLQVSVSTSGRDAALSVRDSGAGLEPDDLERVFDLFTQVDGSLNSGLGIGLALVRGIVELHGGMVEAKSQGKDRGAEFRVLLPLSEATQVTSVVKAQAPPPIHSSCRILVVDDNVDSADMMGALLQLRGHHVHVVHDAHSAIAAAKAFAPDTALLDIGLPDMDGYELARRLKKDHRKHRLRLIAVTGWGQDQDRKRAQQAGFDAHVTKPADPDALLRIIDGVHAS